jgi:hypothetical protein
MQMLDGSWNMYHGSFVIRKKEEGGAFVLKGDPAPLTA